MQDQQHEILIRPATVADMAAVHALMFELALYEKAPEAVQTTVAEYERDFAAGLFQSKVALVDGKVVGMILYFMTYSSWKGKMLYLDDFMVTESYRRFGVGQLLFDAFLDEAREQGCRLVKWQVLDWNEPAIRFYERQGARVMPDWRVCRLEGDALAAAADVAKS